MPRTRLWFDLERYGEAGAVAVIESRIQEAGGAPHQETAVEIMARQRAEQQAAVTRDAVVTHRRQQGLGQLLQDVRAALTEIIEQSDGLLVPQHHAAHIVGATTPYYLTVEFVLQLAAYRMPRDGDLLVEVWRGSLRESPAARPLMKEPFLLDLIGPNQFGWRSIRDQHLPALGHRELADWGVKRLLEQVDSERARERR